jgi:hypothetical protein
VGWRRGPAEVVEHDVLRLDAQVEQHLDDRLFIIGGPQM